MLPSLPVLNEKIRDAEAVLDRIAKERARLLGSIGSACQVMGTTLAKALRPKPLMDEVDTVIIDEVDTVDPPSAWCAAGLTDKRGVVAGDFRQLPAITWGKGSSALGPAEQRHTAQWMARDAFYAAGVIDAAGKVIDDPRLVSLGVQYRMRPDICEVVYPESPLTTGRGDDSRPPRSPLLERSVLLVDTASRRVSLQGWDKHQSNHVHDHTRVAAPRRSTRLRPRTAAETVSAKSYRGTTETARRERFGRFLTWSVPLPRNCRSRHPNPRQHASLPSTRETRDAPSEPTRAHRHYAMNYMIYDVLDKKSHSLHRCRISPSTEPRRPIRGHR